MSPRGAVSYSLYGLRLISDINLPYPTSVCADPPDVEIREASRSRLFDEISPEYRGGRLWYCQSDLPDGSIYLRWGQLFEFLVSPNGHSIACRPLQASASEAFHTYLLGHVLSFALVKQGLEPLHATTIVVRDEAIGFLGSSGDGKSTLAAAFLQAGFRILTDDLLVLRKAASGYDAHPGPARIKLTPEAAYPFLGPAARGAPMDDIGPKLVFPLENGQYCPAPAPLRAIYLLSRRGPSSIGWRVRIRNLSGRQAYLALSRYTFNRRIQDRERQERQFLTVSEIASRIPVKLLSYPEGLDNLPAVREAILADLNL